MYARVVYESMFGNTAAIAHAIASALSAFGTVEVVEVSAAAAFPAPAVGLLVVGGPTHAFGLSRVRTRRDAATRTDADIAIETGIREWLDAALPVPAGSHAAAFGTKVGTPSWLPGSAARGTAKRLRRLGYGLVAAPEDFLVEGMTGPLAPGEIDRAKIWAERLAHGSPTSAPLSH
ncbi:hypothetical protein ABZ540_17505 [Nocardia xishanensis]|uniref:hypothetical protein n=1 Tax=Nocardia xishanensis TaxID=238964 RepID=UPI0033C940A9